MTDGSLKLKARDAEDAQVISAVLQDAIVPVCDIIYRPAEKDFVMIAQRFCREGEGKDRGGCFERVRSAIHVKGVLGTQSQGIDFTHATGMLDLLAVMPEEDGLQFVFAGGGRIRLKLADWLLVLEDFGAPWPTTHCPSHPGENPPA